MDGITIQSFGAAAGVLIVVYLGFQNAPNLIKAIQGGKEPKPDSFVEIINNNTTATNKSTQATDKLIQFLDKSEAIREERDKQLYSMLGSIDRKVDTMSSALDHHATRCDSICRKSN